jgi:TP901 family phage tail tape measure protein
MTAMEVGSLFLTMGVRDSLTPKLQEAKTEAQSLTDRLRGVGDGLGSAGGALTTLFAPAAAALGVAVNSSNQYATALTNIQAVTGASSGEIAALRSQLMSIGVDSTAGPQAVAEAYYDVAGGVTDASARMATLQAAVSLSQAGNASLEGSTRALIGVMNSYKFSADQAGFASDVMTRAVGAGVLTMDELASAIPMVSGVAASLGIGFDDLGAMTAYLTTQGTSASAATTQLGAMMSALQKPIPVMSQALAELGFSTGEAAIEQLGLVGALMALAGTQTAASDGMATLLGTQEALRGYTGLANADFTAFTENFKTNLAGATAAAEAVQMSGPAQQFALLTSNIQALGITVGTALTPALIDITNQATPVINSITEWIGKNPELTSQIAMLVIGGAALGGVLMFVSGVVSAGGVLLGGMGALLGILTGPIGLVAMIAGAVALLGAGEGGLPGGLSRAATAAQQLVSLGLIGLQSALNGIVGLVNDAIRGFKELFGLNASANQVAPMPALPGGGLIGNLPSFNQNAIGPISGVNYTTGPSAAPGDNFMNWYNSRPGRASGGAVMKNQPYRVGEAGEELFVPDTSGEIIPNGRMGGITIQNMTINASSEEGGRAAARGFREELNMLMQATG